MKRFFFTAFLLVLCIHSYAQVERWQQRVKYNIDVKLDVTTHLLQGTQQLEYWNNSPDTLKRVFFHLYWNAFQPGSSMDVRSRELGKVITRHDRQGNPIPDWDQRVKDTISKLAHDQVGHQTVKSIKLNGVEQKLRLHETILEVMLDKPLLPSSSSKFTVVFEAQVPVQIRRSGRDNSDGIKYSMAQWYPKMAEYDHQGWQVDPYVAREFHGVWGDYNVKITLDKNYMVAASGVLQQPNSIGMGYSDRGLKVAKPAGNTLTWNFIGNNIHDFVWTADDNYTHEWKQLRKDLIIRVFYRNKDASSDSAWRNVLWAAEKVLPYMEKRFGKYPWPQYSFIQGGDGGMEYAMATLLRTPDLATVIHEWLHSWYQQAIATNETLYPWLDEGFTTYAEDEVMHYYLQNWANKSPYISEKTKAENTKKIQDYSNSLPHKQYANYVAYYALQKSPFEEPMTTHSDHFNTNYAYSYASYFKGAVFVEQLGYITGATVRDQILLEYYRQWKFRHPDPNDFMRVAEKVSGMELDWYKEYWIHTTKAIDYSIGNITYEDGKTKIILRRLGKMPMPIDVLLTFKDGSRELHYIPLDLMYAEKPAEDTISRTVHLPWRWTHLEYLFETSRNLRDLRSIEIDPSKRMADVNQSNNILRIPD